MDIPVQHGLRRVFEKLEISLNNGNYYEAHQMYRTLYFRYLGQKKYVDLIELLYNGSLLFLQREQYTSGADLGILLIDVLKKSFARPSLNYFEKVIKLFSLMNPFSPERELFVQNALRWSMINSNYKNGHPIFHERLAKVYWNEKNYSEARHHFLYTNDGSGCASMLIELHERQGLADEIELFITQTILQYLCLRNKATAIETFKSYIAKHPKIKAGPPFHLPLLNFSYFLLKSIETKKISTFRILCGKYLTSLTKDPSFTRYLDKISQLFFNTGPSHNLNRGIFTSFLQSFFNGLDEEDTNEYERVTNSKSYLAEELD